MLYFKRGYARVALSDSLAAVRRNTGLCCGTSIQRLRFKTSRLSLTTPSRVGAMVGAPLKGDEPMFTILEEEMQHQRYLTLYNRKVKFPSTPEHPEGPVHDYDIIGHPGAEFHYCVTFPFHSASTGRWQDGEVTLIKEYAQGINEMVYCLPTGGYDPRKHANYEECAMSELSEEAFLKGGTPSRLLDDGPGVPEVKWCRNRFTPFINVDPVTDDQPGKRDQEEFIQVLRVTIPELRVLMRSGSMLLPSVSTCWWAMEWLEEQRSSHRVDDTNKL